MEYKNSIRITGLQGVIEKRLLAIQSETVNNTQALQLIHYNSKRMLGSAILFARSGND